MFCFELFRHFFFPVCGCAGEKRRGTVVAPLWDALSFLPGGEGFLERARVICDGYRAQNDGSVRRVLYKYFLVDVVGRGSVDVIHREIYVTSRIVININFIQNFRCLELNRSEVIATVEWNEMKKKIDFTSKLC